MLIDCLRNEGVERIFGIPGEENLDVMDEIHSSGMEFVLTRHEQAAAFMAGTVGRLTGRPGVCLSTLGPGATNLVTGVADAYPEQSAHDRPGGPGWRLSEEPSAETSDRSTGHVSPHYKVGI